MCTNAYKQISERTGKEMIFVNYLVMKDCYLKFVYVKDFVKNKISM
ncbi:hypothetical protein C823_007630 [Eubacterium plexicaudatum ASF492]|nr:hypothetical protein C823_007630 [Eubacterium plexicaudatum ASF492]